MTFNLRTGAQLVLALAIVVLSLPGVAWAAGQLHGSVADPSGLMIPGAQVVVVEVASGQTRTVVADNRGEFSVDGLAPGRYTLSASATGFEVSRTDVDLTDGAAGTIRLVLLVAAQRASITVTGVMSPARNQFSRESERTSDTASLLGGIAGVSVAANGGVSGIPSIHGLGDDRVKLSLDGMTLAAACSGHMNPPLSYVDPANVGSITVMAGITPVSAGGDSIGGSIVVESPRPTFAASALEVHGSASAYTRTNSNTGGGSASFSAATEHLRASYTGSYVNADNYTAGGGDAVKSTFYESSNHALQLAMRGNGQTLTADVSMQRIPEQGFVNARMDMTRNDATLGSLRYEANTGWGHLDARGYVERTRHEMNILRDKIPGMNMPMETKGANTGYSFAIDRQVGSTDHLKVGTELHRFHLDDWWPGVMPMVSSMGPDTLQNVNNGRRTRIGTFGEFEARRGAWTMLAGLRSDIVSMNTDNVSGYNMSTTATGSAAYYADAVEFNALGHARRDYNVDATVLAKTAPTASTTFEVGYARKTRSPNLYERYLWVKRSNMSVQMNGWFGDGNGYTGNLDVNPEVAHTLSTTAGWHRTGERVVDVSVTPYVTRVNDYIDVDRCAVTAGGNGCTAAKLTATSGFVNLQFANHDARLYGADLTGRATLAASEQVGVFSLRGIVNYVNGRILDTGDNIYRLMPLDATLTLEHQRNRCSSAVSVESVAAKRDVQQVRNELATAGYTLMNVRTGYQFQYLRLDVGVDNLTDRRYVLPTGGRYWIGDTTGATGVPGIGRSFYVGLTAKM